MLSFKDYLIEGGPAAVVSVDITKSDIKRSDTKLEINRNLAAVLSQDFVNPYAGWVKTAKILRSYGLELPRTVFPDLKRGSYTFVVRANGGIHGASLDGTVTPPGQNADDTEDYFTFTYEIDEHGFYHCTGLLSDKDDDNVVPDSEEALNRVERGELDPRQPK